MIIHWLALSASIVFEVGATSSLKLSVDEFYPWVFVSMLCYILAFSIFIKALEYIPLDSAYAIWSAVGTVSMAGINVAFFAQTLPSSQKVGCIVLLVLGSVGLVIVDR